MAVNVRKIVCVPHPWYLRWGLAILNVLGVVIRPLKDAGLEIKVNSVLFLSMMGKVFWLIPFIIYPDVFNSFPAYYQFLKQEGPQWEWALAFWALMCLDVFVIMRKHYEGQIVALGIGALFWLFLSKQIAGGVPHGMLNIPASPMSLACFGSGTACMIVNYRMIQAHNALMDAQRMVLIGRQTEQAFLSGEKWAQPREDRSQEKSEAIKPVSPSH